MTTKTAQNAKILHRSRIILEFGFIIFNPVEKAQPPRRGVGVNIKKQKKKKKKRDPIISKYLVPFSF